MPLDRTKTLANAEKYAKAGKVGEAIAEYRKLFEDNSRDMGVLNKLGDLCVRAGKNQDAIRFFLRIAEFYAADGFFLKAIAMYKKVSKLDPANVDCLQKLAGLYHQQGLTIEAKAQYLAVADRHIKGGHAKKAIEVFASILEIEPDNMKIRMTYADMLVRAGVPKEAGAQFRVIAQDLARKGMLDEAIKVAQKGTKIVPGDPDMMSLALALTREAEKSPGELLSTVVAMAKANGDNPRSLALLGEAYVAAGKNADAEKVFQKLRGMDDAPPDVAAALARFDISRDDAEAALEWVSRAADGYLGESRSTDAAGMMDEFLRAFPNHRGGLTKRAAVAEQAGDKKAQFEALQSLAEALLHSGEREEAAGILRTMQALDPQNPKSAEMQQRLQSQKTGGATAAAAPAGAETPRSRPPEPRVPDIQEGALDLEAGTEVEIETEETEVASGSDALGEVEDEAYGPQSKIQDMQAEPDEEGDEPEDDDFITEHFTEAEVFVKYGLLEKAKEQLLKILEKHPKHVASHSKLKEIYYEEGDKEKAVAECLSLASIMKTRNRAEEAQDLVNEAIRIDPNNPLLREFTTAPAAAPAKAAAAKTPAVAPAKSAPAPRPVPPVVAKAAPAVSAPTPELEIEEIEGEGELEIEPTSQAAAPAVPEALETDAGDLEVEIDVPEEPPARKPAEPARAAAPVGAPPRTSERPAPEKIEEETPDDLTGGLSLGSDDDEITIEVEEDGGAGAPVPAGADQPMRIEAAERRDPDAEKLGEVDFYIDQGLLEEARAVLFQLQKQYPGSQEVANRFERANRPIPEAATPMPSVAPPSESGELDLDVERAFGAQTMVLPAPRPVGDAPRATKATPVFRVEKTEPVAEGDFFDLAGELDRSLAEAHVAVDTQEQEALEGPGHSLDEIFRAFKKGVEQQVDSQDYETHYNLGIAYKEMGLVDEAIGEFQYAARDPAKTVECCGILGLCFREKGMPQLALKWYQKGLALPGLGEHEAIGLRYDVAEVHREQGDYKKAMQIYTEVYGLDSTYRDVTAKIKEMKKLLG